MGWGSDDVLTGSTVLLPEPGKEETTLLVIGDGAPRSCPVPRRGTLTIGRSRTSSVRIDHSSISRNHAVLEIGTEITITDLGSANGTQVGGVKLTPNESVTVHAGDLIDVGSAMIVVQRRSVPIRSHGVRSHDYFECRLVEECARSEHSHRGFAVLRIVADPGVDDASIVRVIADSLRAFDVMALYAPGDYELMVPEISQTQVEDLRRRIAGRLASAKLDAHIAYAMYPRDGRAADSLIAAVRAASRLGNEDSSPPEIVTPEGAMQQISLLVERVAVSDVSVLITGETGVGKEVLADKIHRMSKRSDGPMVRLNCAALSQSLIESELFGFEQGAFTGADRSKIGLLETGNGGTVFLDEIGELPNAVQVKLLRVLEDRRVLRVGALAPRDIDVRFIAATNRDLEAEVARGAFRRDLYFRLNVVPIEIPPLRERRDEIESLAVAFVAEAAERQGLGRLLAIAPDAMELLQQYMWPGNIRELRNVIERAVILCTGDEIRAEHLPAQKMAITQANIAPAPSVAPTASSAPEPHDAPDEKQRIAAALESCGGNQSRTAEVLGISRNTLMKRMDKHGIPRPGRHRSSRVTKH